MRIRKKMPCFESLTQTNMTQKNINTVETAFNEGRIARKRTKLFGNCKINTYDEGTEQFDAWELGYNGTMNATGIFNK